MRLVIHAPTAAALDRAMSNAGNFLQADHSAEVEIVVNAAAVSAVLADPKPFLGTGAKVLLCRNTLDRQGLAPPPGAHTVPAAVLHIAERQAEGWAYMRA